MFDVVIVGAGMAGLLCGARLARAGLKVQMLEKKPQAGGTSAVFRRGAYAFPMGPLAFSYPGKVNGYLAEAGITEGISFLRDHYQLVAPGWDIILSRPLRELQAGLKARFPAEERGLDGYFAELENLLGLTRDLEHWHPDYTPRRLSTGSQGPETRARTEAIRQAGRTPCSEVLDRFLSDRGLKDFLGSMGVSPPEMSWLNLGLMWSIMSEVGVWTPRGGIHGLGSRLQDAFAAAGGKLTVMTTVRRILVENGRAAGVKTGDGAEYRGGWVVSNADVKRTFLDMLDPSEVPAAFLETVRRRPYTDSELCVYIGLDPARVDLSRMKAHHLILAKEARLRDQPRGADFDDREVEVCRWSAANPGNCPPGRESLVLRTAFPYDEAAGWKTGEKTRRPGYMEMKRAQAASLLRTVESELPGLGAGLEFMEVATPLTYEDWGNRFRGSIAGWTWAPDRSGFSRKLLVETPLERLLSVGVYASSELFLGGVPTALFTGRTAADLILEA